MRLSYSLDIVRRYVRRDLRFVYYDERTARRPVWGREGDATVKALDRKHAIDTTLLLCIRTPVKVIKDTQLITKHSAR